LFAHLLCSNKGQVLFKGEIITKCKNGVGSFKFFSSPEPLGQFQPDLEQITLRWRGFKFVQTKGINNLQGEIIAKE
jgi:hypothetical protein